jgi:hypothetical protein
MVRQWHNIRARFRFARSQGEPLIDALLLAWRWRRFKSETGNDALVYGTLLRTEHPEWFNKIS